MFRKLASVFRIVAITLFLTGCASIALEDVETTQSAKTFAEPNPGNAGVYIFRDSFVGTAVTKSLWIDEQCIGATAIYTFFHTEVPGNQEHKFSTESEFSPNHLVLFTEEGQNYFLRQDIRLGVFAGQATLKLVEPEVGQSVVKGLKLASLNPDACPKGNIFGH